MTTVNNFMAAPDKNYISHICRFVGVILVLFIFIETSASSKIDTVYFQNGDRVTGEVKNLNNNLLKFSTSDAGSVNIEWDKIDSIFIINPMRITMMNGEIKYGNVHPSGKLGECILRENNGALTQTKLLNIVEMIPLEKRIVDRLSGMISSGFSFVKASEVTQLDFAGNIEYKGEKIVLQGNYNVILTRESIGTTQRQNGGASLYRVLPKNWSIQGKILAESNSYFELDLRTTLVIAPNYFIIRNNKQRLSTGAGLMVNRELAGDLSRNNLEALVQVRYLLYLFDNPDISINFEANLIPGLSEFGRFRSEMDSNISWEIFNDFFLKWTVFNSFDNQPLSGVDVKRDWGLTFGLEYDL